MALMVFLQEDEDGPSVYRNLKIFCETAPRSPIQTQIGSFEKHIDETNRQPLRDEKSSQFDLTISLKKMNLNHIKAE